MGAPIEVLDAMLDHPTMRWTQTELAESTGYSVRSVRRGLRILQERDMVYADKRYWRLNVRWRKPGGEE